MDIIQILVVILLIVSIFAVTYLGLLSKTLIDSIKATTKNIDNLSNETKIMLTDVNKKLVHIDPLFIAAGQVGETVSKANDSIINTAKSFQKKRQKNKTSLMNLSKNILKFINILKK